MRRHPFLRVHPGAQFSFLALAMLCTMLTLHPAYVLLSLLCAGINMLALCGMRSVLRMLRGALPFALITALLNPLVNHRGITRLFQIGHTPFTWESLLFGLCTAGMLLSMLLWSQCYQRLITTDRFLYLFGHIAPSVALMSSMIMRWIPLTAVKSRAIQQAQQAFVPQSVPYTYRGRIRRWGHMAGALLTWSMESAMQTADAMRARGYGATRRSHFMRYRIRVYDTIAWIGIALLASCSLLLIIHNTGSSMFYPMLKLPVLSFFDLFIYAIFLLYPLLIFLEEVIRCRLRP